MVSLPSSFAVPDQALLHSVEADEHDPPDTPSRLERMAHQLAAQHVIGSQPAGYARHLAQLSCVTQQLQDAHQHLVNALAQDLASSSAAEWLLDNYYMVVRALRQIEEDLPESYYRQLPKLTADDPLSNNPRAGQSRIYAAANAFWAYEEHQLDQGRLSRFVAAYQQVHAFTIGELWALPTMLRLALLETLAQAAGRITRQAIDTDVAGSSPAAIASSATLNDNDVVANCILSLRRLNSQDWNHFFEGVSLVQKILSQDSAGIYAQMDFASRDRYRGVVEMLAHATSQDEMIVAQKAIDLTVVNNDRVPPAGGEPADAQYDEFEHTNDDSVACAVNLDVPHRTHVGYYLFEQGRPQLEKSIGYRPRGMERLRRGMVRYPTAVYLGGIGLLTGLIVAGFVVYARIAGGVLPWQMAVAFLALIPALTLAVSLVNGMVSRLLAPRVLPKLAFTHGIPPACRTMVVVPCLIATDFDVTSLTNQLELHYLRNTDPHLSFALLSDFGDARQAEMPEDAALIALAQARASKI